MRNLFICVFLFLAVIACKYEKTEFVEPKLEVNQTLFEFNSSGGEQILIIESNVVWQIEYNSDWCMPSIESDSGDATIIIRTDSNDSTFQRETVFELKSIETNDVNIAIQQFGKVEIAVDPKIEYEDMRNLSSIELSQLMGLGWNLGNSLEAIYGSEGALAGDETSWGNPRISQGLIDSIKAAGFNAVRIPVSWSHQLEDEYSYTIKESWLKRVGEVVDYVISNQMYAIINIHWDGGWMDHPDYAHQDEINYKIDAIWSQVANYFVNYPDYLLFAGTNEVHEENQWGAPTKENVEVQNSFNQTFIDAVRNTGGKNTQRHLVVQGYVTNIDYTVRNFIVPTDISEDRMMLEVHFYDPYDFALQESGGKTQWRSKFACGDVSNWGQES